MADLRPTHGETPFDVTWNNYESVARNTDGTIKPAGISGYPADAAKFLNGAGAWVTPTVSGGLLWPATSVQVWVDYANGSDSNTGLGPGASDAFKTIAAAYSYLKTYALANYSLSPLGVLGVGTINLLPGDHDVGSGLAVDYRYPVDIIGSRAGAWGYRPGSSASRIVSSSAAATEFIKTGDASNITYGNRIHGVTFLVTVATNTALTACVRAQDNDYFNMDGNVGMTDTAANKDIPLLEQHSGAASNPDNAWLRFTNNSTSGLPLYHADATGGNYNRSLIGWNVCQFGSGATYPMLWLEGSFAASVVIMNNLEGGASGPHCMVGSSSKAADNNLFLGNAGEAGTTTYPFYQVVRGSANQFIGGWCSSSAVGTWIQFDTNGYGDNEVYNPRVSKAGTSGFKQKYVDNSSFPAANRLYGKGGRVYPVKTGTGAKFSDSDFPGAVTPADGTINGLTYDPTARQHALSFTNNSAYKRIVADQSIAVIQRKFYDEVSQTATTVFNPGSTIQPQTLAVLLATANSNKAITGITDSAGNTWAVDFTVNDGTRALSVCSSQIATAVTTAGTVTVTWSTATSGDVVLWIQEAANIAASSAFDQSASGTGTGTALATSASSALAQANELVFGVFRTTGSGAGWTKGSTYSDPTQPQSTTRNGSALEFKVVAATTAVTADGMWGASGTWIGALATYKGL